MPCGALRLLRRPRSFSRVICRGLWLSSLSAPDTASSALEERLHKGRRRAGAAAWVEDRKASEDEVGWGRVGYARDLAVRATVLKALQRIPDDDARDVIGGEGDLVLAAVGVVVLARPP